MGLRERCASAPCSGNRYRSSRRALLLPQLLHRQLGHREASVLLPVVGAARLSGPAVPAIKLLTTHGQVSAGNTTTKSPPASLNTGRNAEAKAKTHFGLSGACFLGAVLSGVLRATTGCINHGDKCKPRLNGIHCFFPPRTALIHGQNT